MYDIGQILEYYGAEVPRRWGYAKMRCPFHHDTHPSASVHHSKGRFGCFACSFNGDAIDVIRWREDCGYADAIAKATQITGTRNDQLPIVSGQGEFLPPRQRDRPDAGGAMAAWRGDFT